MRVPSHSPSLQPSLGRRGDIPRKLAGRLGATLGVLCRIALLELAEVEGHVLGDPILSGTAAIADVGDYDLFHLKLKVFEVGAAGLADRQHALVDVLAV